MKTKTAVSKTPRQKNWFGRECHPSDSLIHWGDDHRVESFRFYWADGKFETFDQYVDAVRAAWDLVHKDDSKVAAAFKLLMDAKGHVDSMEEGERRAGEDL